MEIEIYRVLEIDGSSFIKEEVCRNCAEKFIKKGFEVEFDKHLFKYTEEVDGISYYLDGSDNDNPEITCSECGEYLITDKKEQLN